MYFFICVYVQESNILVVFDLPDGSQGESSFKLGVFFMYLCDAWMDVYIYTYIYIYIYVYIYIYIYVKMNVKENHHSN
jgi:hypothetical protein